LTKDNVTKLEEKPSLFCWNPFQNKQTKGRCKY